MKKIILASSSPRRKAILEDINLCFEIIPSSYEEFLENSDFSYEKIENLAFNKANAVALDIMPNSNTSALVIGADTVVVLDGQIMGKPKDEDDAIDMLKKLSGKTHSVVTSICVIDSENKHRKSLSTTSYVEFHNLSQDQIKNYVQNYKPLDKAGSYGIQELPEGYIKNVEGSFENIIGLCPLAVKEVLKSFT